LAMRSQDEENIFKGLIIFIFGLLLHIIWLSQAL
jgi:hypothetical protein